MVYPCMPVLTEQGSNVDYQLQPKIGSLLSGYKYGHFPKYIQILVQMFIKVSDFNKINPFIDNLVSILWSITYYSQVHSMIYASISVFI